MHLHLCKPSPATGGYLLGNSSPLKRNDINTMFDISLSVVAWLAVVIFQAIIHFGVIGPRSRRQRERLEKEQMEIQSQMEECDKTISTGDEYEQYAASLASAAVEQAEEAEAEAEEAETDSCDETTRSSLHEGRASFTRRIRPHLARKYGGSLSSGCSRGSFQDLDPARVDGSHSEGEDDGDNGSVDEDEPWRYELVRYYYSPRSPHVIQLDRYRQHEDYDSDDMDDTNEFRSRMKARRSWNNSRRNMRESNGSIPGRNADGVPHQPMLSTFPPPQDGTGSVLRRGHGSEKNKDRHVAFMDCKRSSSLSGLVSQVIPCA